MNVERLKRRFNKMAEIGATERGGVQRLALSDLDKEARDLWMKWAREANFNVRFDDFGNMYARLNGRFPEKRPIVLGSHLDSVPQGGRFDGTLGVLVGFEIMESLKERELELQHPVEVAVFSNEEGARFPTPMLGSGAITGVFTKQHVYDMKDNNELRFEDELKRIGYQGEETNRLKQVEAFIELHIEQGPVLESRTIPVGVVKGIQGLSWHQVQFSGESDHAGTTPLDHRKDPLLSAVRAVYRINSWVNSLNDETLVTFGKFHTMPGTINVIPSEVTFSMDIRHPDRSTLLNRVEVAKRLVREIALEDDTLSLCEDLSFMPPVDFDHSLIETLKESCGHQGIEYLELFSGAGHDAMYLNRLGRTVMVFTPSTGGKSHCEEEETSWEDIKLASAAMEQTVAKLSLSRQEIIDT
ncbi:Zn-dependent hydrolase [Halobacillus salinarum]|uniref:Zn-dependent hydrolase n=1 Tax=Halobacillus salinarum TaxID=2932257 RepID=A0ABY4EIH6_9BACI|nr:Zn-dependent hydrolase [Halobacillus salinarum]UOQ44275.1 Zn-dependent hydrolase [Halobacillus salinarum]